jgi:DNA-binding NtrC family response regulator
MKEEISALLIHDEPEPLDALDLELASQSVKTRRARTCQEAVHVLAGADPPHLIFTDTTLPDGSWDDVLSLAAKAAEPISVIVVARFVDIKVYIDTLERGACDFITPPFMAPDLAHVVRCAVENVRGGRRRHVRAA